MHIMTYFFNRQGASLPGLIYLNLKKYRNIVSIWHYRNNILIAVHVNGKYHFRKAKIKLRAIYGHTLPVCTGSKSVLLTFYFLKFYIQFS